MTETRKLGEMLVASGLLTPGQLQEALRHQRVTGGRMGSNLVAMGLISEDLLMDFLSQQTGVPRLDVKHLTIPNALLERIPRRLAEQLVILPVAFKEPKSLVLAMADPSDLNAVDSARFASGMNIEPMVASHSALKAAIAEHYHRLETGLETTPQLELDNSPRFEIEIDATPFSPTPLADPRATMGSGSGALSLNYPKDPFFGAPRTPMPVQPMAPPPAPEPANPFSLFADPKPAPPPRPAPAPPKPTDSQIIHVRSAMGETVQPLESFGTRALVLGLIKSLQRRGVLGEGELNRLLVTMAEAKEIDPRE